MSTTAPTPEPSFVVVGAGAGTGRSAALRFAAEGYAVGLLARREGVAGLVPGARWALADAASPSSLAAGLAGLGLGTPDVVLFSPLPSVSLIKPVLSTSAADLTEALALSVGGPAGLVDAVGRPMAERGSGTLLFISGSGALRPSPERVASAVATTGLAAYVRLVGEALAPYGVRVAHLTVAGAVGSGLTHEPDAVAEALWRLHADADPDLFPVLD
jgi:NAD(P)-dependent dehydrogenase (short-subunit alcohol dehydrogenase family)